MIYGFTGTRNGMTDRQKREVELCLRFGLKEPGLKQFHHGDCIGADVQAAEIAQRLGYETIAHPGFNPRKPGIPDTRAFHISDVILPPLPFKVRDREIVNCVEEMIATPAQAEEQLRSGTWTTVRYARKAKRYLVVIPPAGPVHFENIPPKR